MQRNLHDIRLTVKKSLSLR